MRGWMLVMVALVGCGTEVEEEVDPNVPELADGWNEFKPGGDTVCARGDEYAFFVRKGKVNKVVVDFMGGGACWDELTCGFADSTFSPTVDGVRAWLMEGSTTGDGIYDDANEENPFKDWYHVVVPYCTGDIHWGDKTSTYGEGFNEVTINHKGAVNSRAVLDWMETEFTGPDNVFVTGCSAGAYGSVLWTPHLAEAFPGAVVAQHGDSGAGVVTDSWFEASFPQWNAEPAFPAWIPSLDPATNDILDKDVNDLYAGIASYYPEIQMSQFNSNKDETQSFFYQVMGGSEEDWSPRMRAGVYDLAASHDNFSYFLESGRQHCVIPMRSTYNAEQDGQRFVDFLGTLAEGEKPDSVACAACENPSLE